mgnify:CR=1 FL=1
MPLARTPSDEELVLLGGGQGRVVVRFLSDLGHQFGVRDVAVGADHHDGAGEQTGHGAVGQRDAVILAEAVADCAHVYATTVRKRGVTKPVITRALDSMGKLELVSRRRDEQDRRNVLVQRTVKGALYLERLADLLGNLARTL